jgi:hypothetical protein
VLRIGPEGVARVGGEGSAQRCLTRDEGENKKGDRRVGSVTWTRKKGGGSRQ